MIEGENFEIYLYIRRNKFVIYLLETQNLKNLYKDELKSNNNTDINFDELIKFLDNNIFKIEKLIGKFIENIFLIIEDTKELQVEVGIKKKNNDNVTNQKNLNQALVEAKDLFTENFQDYQIIHMIICKFIINGKNSEIFISNLNSEHIYLDLKFITLSNDFTKKFDKILKRYQIKIKQFMSGKYIKEITTDDDKELSKFAYKIKSGSNPNEISIIPKIHENKGFFEKFFQLFS